MKTVRAVHAATRTPDGAPARYAEWPRFRTNAFLIVLAAACVAEITARFSHRYSTASEHLLNGNSFVAYSLMAAFALHAVRFAGWRERMWLTGAGAMLCAASLSAFGPAMPRESLVAAALTLVSLLTHVLQVMRGRRRVAQVVQMLMRQWLVPLAASLPSFYLGIAAHLDTRVPLDDYLYRFEEGLGIRIGVLAYRAYFALPGLSDVAALLYMATPGVMLLQSILDDEKGPDLAILFAVSAALGFIAYQFYPAVGPHAFFLGYYDTLWPGQGLTLADTAEIMVAPRNTMPSLHAVWAALMVLNACRLAPSWRCLFLTVAGLILLATVAAGHWFVDVVPSLPFAVAVEALCCKRGRDRLVCCAASMALVVGWMVAFRTGWVVADTPGWLRWGAIGGTLLASAWLARLPDARAGRNALA